MKPVIFCIIAISLCCSCVKEQHNGNEAAGSAGIHVRMTASAEDVLTKINLDGTTFSWEESDVIRLRWADTSYSDNADCEQLSSTGEGASSLFEGYISEYKEEANLYAYYSADGQFVNKTSIAFRKKVKSEQTGNLEDVGDNLLFYSWIKKSGITLEKTDDTITGMSFSTMMSPFFAIVKLEVPSSLGYTTLKMEAQSPIAGHVQIQPQKTWGTLGSSGLSYRPTGTGLVQEKVITISDDGNVLGDYVYIIVMPDSYDETAKNYCCSTESLKFTLVGPSGEVSFEKPLNGKIYNGTLKDLGSIPGSMQPLQSAKLCLMDDNALKATVADTVEHCEFYYEIGKTEAECPEPTTSSSKFYAKNGFELPVTNACDESFIKVLVRKSLPYVSHIIAKGYLRSWTFGNDSPVSDAVVRYNSLIPEVGDTYEVGGMNLYRTNSTPVGVTLNEDHIIMKTCYLAMNAVVENDSDASLYFRVDRNYARGYKLYNDNATFGTTSYNGIPTVASVAKDADEPMSQESFVWNIGPVKKGFQCALRGDGTHAYYAMAFLESGENVTSPSQKSINIALKVQDCTRVPAVVLDTVAVGNSLSQGAEYYFLTGTEGFDAIADPTPSDPRLTSVGICIPVQNKSDRMYIKVLGKCEGCEDVYLKAVLRNWKFDINYIAPDGLETKYDGMTLTLEKMWSDTTYTDNRIGYIGCQKGKAEISSELGGCGWLNANFFAGSFATTFKMFHDSEQIYRIDMPAKTYYSDNDIIKSVRIDHLSDETTLTYDWSYRIWLRNMIFLEQKIYHPSIYDTGGGGVNIEDFEGNTNY